MFQVLPRTIRSVTTRNRGVRIRTALRRRRQGRVRAQRQPPAPPPPPPPEKPPSPVLVRSVRSTWACAQRRLGPTSSATTSTTERFSPSWVSQLRCSRRPATIARAALGEGGRSVLAEFAPTHDVEERRLLLPFAVLLVAPVDGETEAGDAPTTGGVPEFGISGEVSDQCDGVCCHCWLPSWFGATGVRPRPPCRGARPRPRAVG